MRSCWLWKSSYFDFFLDVYFLSFAVVELVLQHAQFLAGNAADLRILHKTRHAALYQRK